MGSFKPTAIWTRYFLLLGLIKIAKDGKTLKVLKYGNAHKLAKLHQLLMISYHISQSTPAFYENIPHKFSGAVWLAGLGSLLDALIGKEEWDSLVVKKEWDIVFSPVKKPKNLLQSEKRKLLFFTFLLFKTRNKKSRRFFGKIYTSSYNNSMAIMSFFKVIKQSPTHPQIGSRQISRNIVFRCCFWKNLAVWPQFLLFFSTRYLNLLFFFL